MMMDDDDDDSDKSDSDEDDKSNKSDSEESDDEEVIHMCSMWSAWCGYCPLASTGKDSVKRDLVQCQVQCQKRQALAHHPQTLPCRSKQ